MLILEVTFHSTEIWIYNGFLGIQLLKIVFNHPFIQTSPILSLLSFFSSLFSSLVFQLKGYGPGIPKYFCLSLLHIINMQN